MEPKLRIRLLGTAAAWPFPRIGCECPMCAEAVADPSRRRTRPAALVWVPGASEAILVDSGPDIHWQLLNAGPDVHRRIAALLVTHTHSDHYLGLDDLSRALKEVRQTLLPMFVQDDNVPVLERTFSYLLPSRQGAREWEKPRFEPKSIVLEQPFEVAGVRVTAFDTFHTDTFTTCGFRFEAGDRSIVYAPDTGRIESATAGRADLLVIDATELDESTESHLSVADALAIGERLEARRIVLTHIGHHSITDADRDGRVAGRGEVARDGMELEV